MSDFKCYLPQAYSLGRVKKIQTQTNVAYIIKRNVGRYSQIKSWGGGGGAHITFHLHQQTTGQKAGFIYLNKCFLWALKCLALAKEQLAKLFFSEEKKCSRRVSCHFLKKLFFPQTRNTNSFASYRNRSPHWIKTCKDSFYTIFYLIKIQLQQRKKLQWTQW